MKILLSAIVTEKFMGRYRKTVKVQEEFFPEGIAGVDRLLLTDDATNTEGVDVPTLRMNLSNGDVFNHSKARNILLDYAWGNGYDWLLDGDADRVVVALPDPFPKPGFTVFLQHASQKDDDPADLRKRWLAGELNAKKGSAFFIIPRMAFRTARFCEDFVFTRWEDVDYTAHVVPRAGIPILAECGQGMHLWHPGGEHILETLTQEGFDANRAIYESRHAKPEKVEG